MLNVLVSFAVGGLLGDAFLHLIPHAQEEAERIHENFGRKHGREHSHEYIQHKRNEELLHNQNDHGHGHTAVGLWVLLGMLVFFILEVSAKMFLSRRHLRKEPIGKKRKGALKHIASTSSTHSGHMNAHSGWLNIVADCTHNFTDGIAIGVSFQISTAAGGSHT